MVPGPPALVIQTGHLGDVVLTLPLLGRLADLHGPVDVVTTPAGLNIVQRHPAIRRAIPFDKAGRMRTPRLLRLSRALRRAGYGRVYLPHDSLRSAILGWLTGSRERIGFAGTPGAFLYTRRLDRPRHGHVSERLLALAPTGSDRGRPWLELQAETRSRMTAWLESEGIPDRFVVLAPGARWGTKRWPYFADLAARLPHPVVVVGGPDDADRGTAIVSAAHGPAGMAAGMFSIVETAALIERGALLVTNDSLALHLASALGRPVVALFGPTAPRFGFGPLDPHDEVVEHPALACRPCSAHGPRACPLQHHRCLRELSVEQVLDAIGRRLEAAGPAGGQDTAASRAEWR